MNFIKFKFDILENSKYNFVLKKDIDDKKWTWWRKY